MKFYDKLSSNKNLKFSFHWNSTENFSRATAAARLLVVSFNLHISSTCSLNKKWSNPSLNNMLHNVKAANVQ